MDVNKSTDNSSDGSDRSLIAQALLWVLTALSDARDGLRQLKELDEAAHDRLSDRLHPVAVGLLSTIVAVAVYSQGSAAQEYCESGIGALIADTQSMLWQFVVGMLVIIILIGLVLRAFPLFAGATATGNLMLVGVIVGVVGFVFIITFIDIAFGYVSGADAGDGCSPFL